MNLLIIIIIGMKLITRKLTKKTEYPFKKFGTSIICGDYGLCAPLAYHGYG